MFLGTPKYWAACGWVLTLVLSSGFAVDIHVSWCLACCKSHQPGTDLCCLWLRGMCPWSWQGSRAVCVSSAVLQAEGRLASSPRPTGRLVTDWHSSWDTHLSPEILLHMPLVPLEQTLLSWGGRNQVRLFLGKHLLHTPGTDSLAPLTNLCLRFKRQKYSVCYKWLPLSSSVHIIFQSDIAKLLNQCF